MAIEKKWLAIAPRQLSADGTALGLIQLKDAREFRVKMRIVLQSSTQPAIQLQIKRVNKIGLIVGPIPQANTQKALNERADVSAYLVADGAFVIAEEQDKSMLKPDDIEQATYEQEPVVAKRVINVDQFGNFYETDNPMPVKLTDGSINIGSVNADLEVQLSHISTTEKPVADSIRIGDGTNELRVNLDGSVNSRQINKLVTVPHDQILQAYDENGNTSVVTYKYLGNVVATLSLSYDSDDNLINVVKS